MNAPGKTDRQAPSYRIHLPYGHVVFSRWARLDLRNEVSDSGYRCNHCGNTVYLPNLRKQKKQQNVGGNTT